MARTFWLGFVGLNLPKVAWIVSCSVATDNSSFQLLEQFLFISAGSRAYHNLGREKVFCCKYGYQELTIV